MNWISVNDRLPEDGDRFLVYDKADEGRKWGTPICMGRITKSWGIAREGENGRNPTITHWMPVEPPKGN